MSPNVLFVLAGGAAGGAPIVGRTPPDEMSDPLPQAMVLTAIVITLGMTAFLLAMAYRSWQLNGHDEVQDDLEDRPVALPLVGAGFALALARYRRLQGIVSVTTLSLVLAVAVVLLVQVGNGPIV